MTVFSTLYKFYFGNLEFNEKTKNFIYIDLLTNIQLNPNILYIVENKKYMILHDWNAYLTQFNIIGDEQSVLFKLKKLNLNKYKNTSQEISTKYSYEKEIFQNAFKKINPLISKKKLISRKFFESYNQIIIRIYKKWNYKELKELKELSDNQSIIDNSETENLNDSFIQVNGIFYNILVYISRKNLNNLLLSLGKSLEINDNSKYKLKDVISNFMFHNIQDFANNQYLSYLFIIFFINNCKKSLFKVYSFFSIIINKLKFINENDIIKNIKLLNESENNDICLILISTKNNDIVNDILLNIFENKINSTFSHKFYNSNNITDETINFLNTTFEYFKECIFFLEKENYELKNNMITKIYCISFIKIFLYKCIMIYHDINKSELFNSLMKVIKENNKSNIIKMIKLYLLKLLFNIFSENNYIKFFDFKRDENISFLFKDFKYNFIENESNNQKYYFLPHLDDFQKYQPSNQDFIDYKTKFDIDIIYISLTNITPSKSLNNNQLDLKFSNFLTNLVKNLDIKDITKKLFLLYNEFEKIKKLITDEEEYQKNLIILLNALRICIQTTNFNDKCLYSQILTENCKDYLKKKSIPGNGYSFDIFIDNFYLIEKFLKSNNSNNGAYVCSCGLFYQISPCGFPTKTKEITKCQNCHKNIGYAPKPQGMKGKHGMVIRDGHYRIFLDDRQKNIELSKYRDNDNNIPNMLLSDYKKNIINQKMKEQELGLSKPSKYLFECDDIKIRKLTNVGYRLLNFILYSHLFFSNYLGKISDEELNNYLCDKMNCMQMIKTN